MKREPNPKPPADRFWSKVQIGAPDQCWEWKAGMFQSGYGLFKLDGKLQRAHRVSYQLNHGPIPDGLFILHWCDNPGCVNPAHLHLGTHVDNMRERGERGRCAHTSGEVHGCSKLTSEQIQQIRLSYAIGGITQQQLGEEFGVSKQQISRIINGKRWNDDRQGTDRGDSPDSGDEAPATAG